MAWRCVFVALQRMPMEHLWSEVEVRDADTSVIIPLLLQIRKAYGHHLKKTGGSDEAV